MTLWTAKAVRDATGGRLNGPEAWGASGISIDSRTVKSGDLFVALRGEQHDGHDHVVAALKAGAVAALVTRIPAGAEDQPLVVVSDTLRALEDLARASRVRSTARIGAVTGSVGKTSTKEMLAFILADQGSVHCSVGSFNNHYGVPLSLARMPADSQRAIFELGMNHAGELTPLSNMVRPHVALITTIAMVHGEFFNGLDDIARAKAEIFDGMSRSGIAVLNADNPQFGLLKAAAEQAGLSDIRSFGLTEGATARLLSATVTGDHTTVEALWRGEPMQFQVGVAGAQWGMNALGALLMVEALGGDVTQAATRLAAMTPPDGRGTRRDCGGILVIDESYNASPVSVAAAFAALSSTPVGPGGRRIAVLGDMGELGEQSLALHRGLAADFTRYNLDLLCAAGPKMNALRQDVATEKQGPWAETSTDLAPMIVDLVRKGDVVMVKGSHSMHMERVVKALHQPKGDAKGGSNNHAV